MASFLLKRLVGLALTLVAASFLVFSVTEFSPGNVARKLARRAGRLSRLVTYQASVEAIPSMQIEVIALTEAIILEGLRLQRRYSLMTNDSLIVATMLRQGVRILASADRRLALVDEIEIAVPADLAPAPQ